MLSRRQLLCSTAALGIVPFVSGTSMLARQTVHARLGDKITFFSIEFGGSQRNGDFLVYGDTSDDLADYWVDTNNTDIAEMVEIDFSPIPGGGLRSSDDILGWSRFLREDADTFGMMMQIGGLNPNRHNFHVQAWHSPTLASDLGRSGNVIVVDEDDGTSSVAEVGNWRILRTQVAMETFNVYPINRTATLPGPDSTVEDWAMNYSLAETADRLAYVVENPPVPGYWLLGKWVHELDISFDEPISTEQSSDLIGSMLAVEGTEAWTTYVQPTPNGPYGMRLNAYNLGQKDWWHYVLRYVKGGETTGTVDRIVIRAENPDQRGR